MAERRMFAKTIVLSDAFLDMPLGARCLYMTMSMLADDDGFVNSPKSIIRQCGASMDDLNVLLAKRFILPFDNGVIVIKHWRINNYLRNDRYKETAYLDEKNQLELDANGAYKLKSEDVGIPSTVYPGKDSIGKNSIGNNILSDKSDKQPQQRKRFVKPSVEEIQSYCNEKGYVMDPQYFFDYYESKGWLVGKTPMKDWKAAVRNWAKNEKEWKPKKEEKVFQSTGSTIEKKEVDPEIERMLREYGTIDD